MEQGLHIKRGIITLHEHMPGDGRISAAFENARYDPGTGALIIKWEDTEYLVVLNNVKVYDTHDGVETPEVGFAAADHLVEEYRPQR